MLRYLCIGLCLLALLWSCNEDESLRLSTNKQSTLIWQGTYHDWTYNHRVNRMGDWIDDADYSDGFTAKLRHSAASGIGGDVNTYKTFTTAVTTTADVAFSTGQSSAIIQGAEGSVSSVTIPVEMAIQNPDHAEALILLNGFDMYARPGVSENLIGDGQADKLFHFKVFTANQERAISIQGGFVAIRFDLVIELGADCASPECSSGPNVDFFDYQVTIAYQLITASESDLSITSSSLSNAYSWERNLENGANEIKREDFRLNDQTISGPGNSGGATLGISSISFTNQKGFGGFDGNSLEYPHMLNFDLAVFNEEYDASSGQMTFDADLFFKNWRAPVPPVSFGGGGSTQFEVGVELLQFHDASMVIEPRPVTGSITWFTNPLNPSPPTIGASLETTGIGIRH